VVPVVMVVITEIMLAPYCDVNLDFGIIILKLIFIILCWLNRILFDLENNRQSSFSCRS